MNTPNDLRLNCPAAIGFDAYDSSIMSCPSFTSSSSCSTSSRRDSMISGQFNQQYNADHNMDPFTGPHSLLDLDGLTSMSDDDLGLSLEQSMHTNKTNKPWNTGTGSLHLSEVQQMHGLSGTEYHYEDRDSSSYQPIEFQNNLSDTMLDDLMRDPGTLPSNSSIAGPAETIIPSLAFGLQTGGDELNMWTSQRGQIDSAGSDGSSANSSDERNEFWGTETQVYHSPASSRETSPIQRSHGGGTGVRTQRNSQRRSLPTIHPRQRHECSECRQKFQRPEHLTRHKKSKAHSAECPYVCEYVGCLTDGKRRRFNRKDNHKAHVVNCHLIGSSKGRRDRVGPEVVEALGWEKFFPAKKKEEARRRELQESKVMKHGSHSSVLRRQAKLAYRS